MSTLAVWSRVARSRDVRSRDISAPTVCLTMFDVGFVESRTCTLNNLSLVPVTFSLRVPNGNPESSIHSQTSSPEAAMSTAVKEFQVTPLNGVLELGSSKSVGSARRIMLQHAGAAQRLWRWGYNFASGASGKFFWPPPPTFDLPGGTWNNILQFSLLQLWRLIYCELRKWFRSQCDINTHIGVLQA